MDNVIEDVYLTSLNDPGDPYTGGKPGVTCAVPGEYAKKLLKKKTHRLSTEKEIAEYRAANNTKGGL